MTNIEIYASDINHNPDYRITTEKFREWLKKENMTELFTKMLRDEELSDYDIAVDYSIPLSMVRHFRKTA